MKVGHVGKSKLTLYAFEEGHKTDLTQARILQFEPDSTYRKCKETDHSLCSHCPISQSSLQISPIWFPFIWKELKCDLGYVPCSLSHRVFYVGSYFCGGCGLFVSLTVLVFVASFYILLDLVEKSRRLI
jgi:hypothetical protein